MSVKRLTLKGLRGFINKTDLFFAIPDHVTPGSGLTIMVGPNNSGKSTVIEAMHIANSDSNVVPLELRNIKNDYKINIEIENNNGNIYSISTSKNGGAFIIRKNNDDIVDYSYNENNLFVLSSRRNFNSTFGNNGLTTRENYKGNVSDSDYRNENSTNHNFGGRLLKIENNKKEFNKCLAKVLSPLPNWKIEAQSNSNLYLEFSFDNIRHSSKGAGEGFINIFNIVDALYDSREDNVILIDEPEISLHPDLQRKLFQLLVEYSKDKQIIISTHSPYFVDWELLSHSSKIIRFKKDFDRINIFELKEETKEEIKSLLKDTNHPHILSLTSNDIFFLNDNVILTEGQEDVVCYKKIFKKYNFVPNASFFGWGAGGADKMMNVLDILNDLGYKKVFVILDNDKKENINDIKSKYKNYECYVIKANDVHNKNHSRNVEKLIKKINDDVFDDIIKEKVNIYISECFPTKEGLVSDIQDCVINEKYQNDILTLINSINNYFSIDILKDEITDTYDNSDNENNDILEEDNIEKAKQLIYKYFEDNKLNNYIKNKFKGIDTRAGDEYFILFRKNKNNKYYAIYEFYEEVPINQKIQVCYYIVVNIEKETVKIKKRKIIKNELYRKLK